MTPDLLARSLKLLRQRRFLIWLGLGMSLSSLFGTGWRLWLAQVWAVDFTQFTNLQTVESLLFSGDLAILQQLFLRGLLLSFGQFVLVWLVALGAEAGLITAVSQPNHSARLSQTLRWGWHRLGQFLAVDLLVFFPWFLIALALLIFMIIFTVLLASFATREVGAGTVLATTGLGLACLLGLAGLLLPVGLVSFWVRLMAFREMVLQAVSPRTAVRQTWQRIRQNIGDVIVLILMLWGGQTVLLSAFSLVTSPLLTWLTAFTSSDRIALQAAAWVALLLATLLVWLVRGGLAAFVAIAWTLGWQNLSDK
ncbi:MAG: hypothetical protein H6656_21820 [Ardenticatenaceae bacterium]|nr:hypothetical protein [Ardenticatenaceae bacterium]